MPVPTHPLAALPSKQDFFLRLVGSYRSFVRTDDGMTPAALALGIDRPVAPQGDRGSRANSTNSRDAEDENPRCGLQKAEGVGVASFGGLTAHSTSISCGGASQIPSAT